MVRDCGWGRLEGSSFACLVPELGEPSWGLCLTVVCPHGLLSLTRLFTWSLRAPEAYTVSWRNAGGSCITFSDLVSKVTQNHLHPLCCCQKPAQVQEEGT